jgi:hypothetical protein
MIASTIVRASENGRRRPVGDGTIAAINNHWTSDNNPKSRHTAEALNDQPRCLSGTL